MIYKNNEQLKENTFRHVKEKEKVMLYEKQKKKESHRKVFRKNSISIKKSMMLMKKKSNFNIKKDFIHKSRQNVLCNNKNLYTKRQNKNNTYTKYLKKVYLDIYCITCKKNNKYKVDDKYHFLNVKLLKRT